MKKILILATLSLVFLIQTSAQDNPIRIGLKFGFPNIAGLNAEYVTPLLGGRVAPTVDFSRISISIADVDATFSYFSFGGNVYLREGKGPYAHLGYGNLSFEGTYTDKNAGKGTGSLAMSFLNFKLGLKTGGRFYFRPEIGYGLPMTDPEIKVKFSDGSTKTEKVPSILANGILINSGFGFAF